MLLPTFALPSEPLFENWDFSYLYQEYPRTNFFFNNLCDIVELSEQLDYR